MEPMELPLGWAQHFDSEQRPYYACELHNLTRWDRPAAYGLDGRPGVWRWAHCNGHVCYLRLDAPHEQFNPPAVGDSLVLPLGWFSTWDNTRQRHYFWHMGAGANAVQWDF